MKKEKLIKKNFKLQEKEEIHWSPEITRKQKS